ncbi:AraC family transcriptional regulator [Crossiella sp. NPDC003009]
MSEQASPLGRAVLSGASLEVLEALYGEYSPPELPWINAATPKSARFWVTFLAGVPDPALPYGMGTSLADTAGDAEFEVRGRARADHYVIRTFPGRSGHFQVDGLEPMDSLVQSPRQRHRQVVPARTWVRELVLPKARVTEALRVRLGEEPSRELRFDPMLRQGIPAVAGLMELINGWADPQRAQLLAASPLALRHFEQLLVQALLDAQPHELSEELDRHAAGLPMAAVRRAMVYCEEHADRPISVPDMAAAAGVAVRQLQRDFQEHLGMGPLEYLRRVRLDNVHQELLAVACGRANGTVAEIARRWGFTHQGRFAQYYRETYGCPPSQTLRQPG